MSSSSISTEKPSLTHRLAVKAFGADDEKQAGRFNKPTITLNELAASAFAEEHTRDVERAKTQER